MLTTPRRRAHINLAKLTGKSRLADAAVVATVAKSVPATSIAELGAL
jgi:hypothetical protein